MLLLYIPYKKDHLKDNCIITNEKIILSLLYEAYQLLNIINPLLLKLFFKIYDHFLLLSLPIQLLTHQYI